MTIVDVNLLLYAYREDAPQHAVAERWLTQLFEGDETVGLPWVTLWGFMRTVTNQRIWPEPLPWPRVFTIIGTWSNHPGVMIPEPGPRHGAILERLVTEYAINGPKVTDAVLAALAIEYGARLASTDQDFRRFPELRWVDPLREGAKSC